MRQAPTQLDKSGRAIQQMFAGVARRYDLLNHLLSAGLDRRWRRRAAEALAERLPRGAPVLDLCCGTGDQAIALLRCGLSPLGADFCLPMLAIYRQKLARHPRRSPALSADALRVPFSDGLFAGGSVSFGLRNVADLDRALAELARLLRPGGWLAVLEFALPLRQPLRALYLLYFQRLLPRVGRLVSQRGAAYSYLPESVLGFPQREGFLDRLENAGFIDGRFHDLTGGIVCLYLAQRAR